MQRDRGGREELGVRETKRVSVRDEGGGRGASEGRQDEKAGGEPSPGSWEKERARGNTWGMCVFA